MGIYSLTAHSSSLPSSKINDTVVDELNRRNSVISATCASNLPYSGNVDPAVKVLDAQTKQSSSEYIPYGNTKHVATSSNESQNVMKGIPTVTSSRYLFYLLSFIFIFFSPYVIMANHILNSLSTMFMSLF